MNEGFDGVTAPALPSWGSTVGSPVTSTSHFDSSPNSLKIAGTLARQEHREVSATDSNYGQVSASAKFYWDATPTANMTLHLYLRATNGPTSSVVPNYCLAAFLGIYSGSSGMVLDYYNSTGTTPTSAGSIAQSVFNGVSTGFRDLVQRHLHRRAVGGLYSRQACPLRPADERLRWPA